MSGENRRVVRVFCAVMLALLALIGLSLQVAEKTRAHWLEALHLPGARTLQAIVLMGAGLAVAGVLAWAMWRRPSQPMPHAAARGLLALALLCAAVSGIAHWDRPYYFDVGDNFHYYLGAKYARELHYDKHYECVGTALQEQGRKLPKRYRDLRDNKKKKLVPALEDGAARACREAFTEERWKAFAADALKFRDWQSFKRLEHRFTDHGYNGTPAWGALSGTLTNAAPLSEGYQNALALLNFALLTASFGLVITAFGWELGLVYVVLFWINYADRYLLGGAVLRYLPIALLLAGAALLKLARPRLAGLCLGAAAALLVFPALFVAAAGLYVALELVAARGRFAALSVEARRGFELVLSAGIAFIACCAVGALYHGGLEIFASFLDKMDDNSGRYASGRIGFVFNFFWPKFLTVEPRGYGVELARLHHEGPLGLCLDHLRLVLGALLVAALAYVYRRAGTLTFMLIVGFALFFVGFPTVRYYYMGWVALPLALHLVPSSHWARALLAALCVMSAACEMLTPHVSHAFLHNTVLSMGLTAVLVVLAIPKVAESVTRARAQPAHDEQHTRLAV